ncbi:MAG: ABC transporter substrate-binding protein [Candidatus Dormibacteria bacterium]
MALTACGAAAARPSAKAPVTLPVIVPLTGPGAEYGVGDQQAAGLAVAKINSTGGIDGHKLLLTYYNSASTASTAAQIMSGLVSSSLLILGPNLSTTAEAAFPIANRSHVPVITSSVSDGAIMSANRPWTYDTFLTAPQVEPQGATQFLAATHAKSVVAIIDVSQAAATAQAATTLSTLTSRGVTVLTTIDVTDGQPTYSSEAATAVSRHPAAFVVSAYPNTGGAVAAALRAAGATQPILFTTTTVTADTLTIGKAGMTNGYVELESWPGDMGAVGNAFDSSFTKVYHIAPEPTAPFMYDAVLLAAAALKDSGALNSHASLQSRRDSIRKLLASGTLTIVGASGTFTMQADGLRSGTALWCKVEHDNVTCTH